MAVRIITDSTCDIPISESKALGIDIISLKVIFGDQEYLDGRDISNKEFYDKLRSSEALPTTVQVNPENFYGVFQTYVDEGDEVLGIFISAELSGTFQSAVIAKEMLSSEQIYLVDSQNTSFGLAVLIYEAVKRRDAGDGAAEIAAHLEELKERLSLYGAVSTLKYLKKGGRLSASSALIGGFLSIKPIVTIENGKVIAAGKARGEAAAFKWLAERVKAEQPDSQYDIIFAHADAPEACRTFQETLSKIYPLSHFRELLIGTVVGTHTGPGCVGISYIRSSKK